MSQSPSDNGSREFVARCIEECEVLTSALKRCLQEERSALEQRDRERLDRAVEDKRDCVARLRHNQPRARIWASLTRLDERHALPSDAIDTQALERQLGTLDPSGRLNEHWATLVSLTQECQRLNERNGELTTRLRNRAEQTLMLIQAAAGQELPTAVYGPDGNVDASPKRVPGSR
ncbi:MAG: flagellar protein FlgN [Pseudomonadota bacterium]